jgi:hypothetical protein
MISIVILLSTILVIVCIILIIIFSFLLKNKYGKQYEVFEYDYNKLCRGHIEDNCPNNANGNFYALLKWIGADSEQYLGTISINETSVDGYYTENYWVTIVDLQTQITVGTMRWSNLYFQKLTPKENVKDVIKTKIPFLRTYVTAASGILNKLQNSNIVTDYRKDIRRIYVYNNINIKKKLSVTEF